MTKIKTFEKPKLTKPIFIEGLPGIGNVGRVVVGYLIKELKAKKFAQLYSEHFFPFVMLHNDYQASLLKMEFYYVKAKNKRQKDIIFLTGDCQSLTSHGHYEIIEKILDFVENYNISEIITIGGLATGEFEDRKPTAYGVATSKKIMEKYKKYNIKFTTSEKVGYIVGAAGLLLGLGKERNIDGLCMLGETSGFPIVTDPKAAEAILKSLTKILNVKVNMHKLEERVKEMENFIKKVEELQQKAVMEIAKAEKQPPKKDSLRYIG